jgi:hypothetical protein
LTATQDDPPAGAPDLVQAIADYRAMIDADALATEDPLGIGGLLVDAHRLAALHRDPPLQAALLRAAQHGLERYLMRPDLRLPAEHRLAFRELGLAIGLAALAGSGAAAGFARYAGVRDRIASFWLDAAHRESALWREHVDINEVMLATCLAPAGFLGS